MRHLGCRPSAANDLDQLIAIELDLVQQTLSEG
jgi:hypothetical protein